MRSLSTKESINQSTINVQSHLISFHQSYRAEKKDFQESCHDVVASRARAWSRCLWAIA